MNEADVDEIEGARVSLETKALELSLEMAERREVPFHGPPTIPLDRIHEAARKAQATPGKTFQAKPPWTSRFRWGYSDAVAFSVYIAPQFVQSAQLAETIVSSHSRYKVHAFVNLMAALRAINCSLDETFRMSFRYETAPIGGGRVAYFVGIAALPGSRVAPLPSDG